MHVPVFFQNVVDSQKGGSPRGIASVCSAHRVVLEAAMIQAREDGLPVLIESTINQVNQFGGYTGMTPEGFRRLVESAAESMGFPKDRIIVGGDHLGPYPWRTESAESAMEKSRGLLAASVSAGYGKIHLDASMPLGGDALGPGGRLDPRTVAEREADLALAAEESFRAFHTDFPEASPPVYVIGTEVPPPGGIASSEDAVPVTRVEDFRETVALCKEAFRAKRLEDAWSRVCAVVAQPGVEYGDLEVHEYDPGEAAALCRAARESPGIVLEGHSTDYQKPAALSRLIARRGHHQGRSRPHLRAPGVPVQPGVDRAGAVPEPGQRDTVGPAGDPGPGHAGRSRPLGGILLRHRGAKAPGPQVQLLRPLPILLGRPEDAGGGRAPPGEP